MRRTQDRLKWSYGGDIFEPAEKGVFFANRTFRRAGRMIKLETTSSVESVVAEMRKLSEEEQRSLAAAVLQDRKLEPFVEELEDHLSCERSEADGPAELFIP